MSRLRGTSLLGLRFAVEPDGCTLCLSLTRNCSGRHSGWVERFDLADPAGESPDRNAGKTECREVLYPFSVFLIVLFLGVNDPFFPFDAL